MRRIVPVFLLLLLANGLLAQNNEKKNPLAGRPFKERVFFGGDLGLSFGTITYVRVAPVMGYAITPNLSVGGGPSYQYWENNRIPNSGQSMYGGSLFGRYYPLDFLFLHTEFEFLNVEAIDFSNDDILNRRVNVPIWWVGGGYSQRSGRSGFFVGIYYDLIQDIYSPYSDDFIIRIGGFVGL